jgi:multiple sugar transport system permease protein
MPDHNARARRAFLAPLTIVLVAVTVFPFAYALGLSLTNADPVFPGVSFIGLGNYTSIFSDPAFWSSVVTTLVFTAIAVTVELGLGTLIGLALSRVRRGSGLLRTAFMLPLAAAPIAVMYDWQVMLNPTYGVIDYLLGLLHLPQPDWFGSGHLALGSLIGIDVWEFTPFIIIIIAGGIASIPQEVYEAADVDGASGFRRFWYVTLPLLRPYLLVALLFRLIDALKVFDSIQVLTSGGPGTSTTTLNYYVFRDAITYLQFGRGTAAALVLLLIALLLTKVLLRSLRKERGAL